MCLVERLIPVLAVSVKFQSVRQTDGGAPNVLTKLISLYSVTGVGFLFRCSIPAIQQSLPSRSLILALIWFDDSLSLVMVL